MRGAADEEAEAPAAPQGDVWEPSGELLKELQKSRFARLALRSSDLKASVEFFTNVLGMQVLRHEEHAAPCAVSSNGTGAAGSWSKTIVGYGPEEKFFAIELVWSADAKSYEKGTGLAHVAVGFDDPESILQLAAEAGFEVKGDCVVGPDKYEFRILPPPMGDERFVYVGMRTKELPQAVDFYGSLGMLDLTWDYAHYAFNRGGEDLMRCLTYDRDNLVPLMIYEEPGLPDVDPKAWDGRHIFTVPEAALKEVYPKLIERYGEQSVLHALGPVEEAAGASSDTAVLKNFDLYEFRMIATEGFTKAVEDAAAAGPASIDWSARA